ncbi:MAG: ATP-binding protein [Thermodesulfobacteriota bacterium]
MSRQDIENQSKHKWSRLRFIALGQFIGLCLLLSFTFFADQRHGQENVKKLAEATARIHAQKDSSHRELFIPLGKAHTRNSLSLHLTLWILGVIGIVWSFQKMRQRDRKIFAAQDAQKKAYEELEKTFDAIDGIITIQDKDMRITRVNKATCDIFNAKPEDLVGKYCYEVFRGANMPCEGCPEVESLQDGATHHGEIEHENLNKIFAVAAVPIINESGETAKLVHYAKDITKSRRQERQLRQAQKMEAVGTLAGGIAHDFNNILTAIIGFSELSLLRPSIDAETHQDLEQIHKAGLRAKELVEQILTFSRQKEQDFQSLEIQSVLKEALKLLRASIPTTINFELNIAEERALIIADPSQVHQVVMNLCTNAYHAMRDNGGTLLVALKQVELAEMDVYSMNGVKPGPYLRLTIGDTGQGIKKEDRDRIFEPYFTTKKKGEGTGLGLSLVHGIISSMGGYISMYSEEGQGTTFQVYLPVIAREDVSKAQKRQGCNQLPTGNERVLLIDDEESIVALEGRMLESLGYTVEGFSDAMQAKDAFITGSEKFDLLITDMNMPQLSGLDLVEIVKAANPDIPIIICTGFSERINRKTAEKYGIYKVVMKPLVLHELAQTVRGALDD